MVIVNIINKSTTHTHEAFHSSAQNRRKKVGIITDTQSKVHYLSYCVVVTLVNQRFRFNSLPRPGNLQNGHFHSTIIIMCVMVKLHIKQNQIE